MDADLIELLSAWQGEEIDPARRQQLLERLQGDAAFQQSFIAEIRMLGMIKVVQATEPRWLRLQDELGWGATEPPAERALEDALMQRVRGIPIRRPRPWRVWLLFLSAAAALVIGATLMLRWPDKPDKAPSPAPGLTRATTSPGRPESAVALVVKLEGARWESGQGALRDEGMVVVPGRYQLGSGRAALSFFSGVTLILEGPADVDVLAVDRVYCRRGRLRARVPEGAKGFVVASPGSAVVDMGTEFALNVEADGKARLMVFEGAAEAALIDATGTPTRTQLVEQSQAFELDPRTGRIAESVAQPEGFVAASGQVPSRLRLDPGYAAAVLAAQPRDYWRFETQEAGAIPNEVEAGAPLRASGGVVVTGADTSENNGCALFPAGIPAQFLATDGLWNVRSRPGHAVELWFMPEGISHASLIGLFPPKAYLKPGQHGRHVHTFLVELTAWDRQSLFKPASVRFLHRWPLDTRIGSNILSDEIYIPGRWHHLVAQKNGPAIELYFDGALAHSLELRPDHPDVGCRLVVGRRTPDPLEPADSRSFVGRIDELALYDHPLSPDEVRRHFQLATIRTDQDGSEVKP
jgi:hypothetical protein